MSLAANTELRLDLPVLDAEGAARAGLVVGDPDPWGRIRVVGRIDHGPDRGGESLIVAPVVFSSISSPIEVAEEKLFGLGYEVAVEGADEAWETTLDHLPKFGSPGWSKAISARDRAAAEAEVTA